ncbi:hypothetical protein [Flavobacterium reichenbachii]|uniref:DUF4412 domain-containing protein n=1 Tax=Flavobacterium reichenbachii TaxID=362418 RepID=A0A085ZQ52_9FLAO|nr:hypothetical protein [Flavobacterium reichenbachii]KFF06566.1 hypothetical protein IW19_14075 [Flavobacterium reichenbachii]OXB18829.1 hypothetical protein B0A68_02115 [Flavobacterium reichenbachii]
MNKSLLFFFLISLKLYCQDFEGKVEYKISYKVISTKENEVNLKKDLGTKTTFIVKNGFYKEITDAEYMNYQLYNPKENRLYFTDKFTPKTLYFYRGQKLPNTKVEYKIIKNAETILGHICDVLIYKTDKYEIALYYSKDLKLNPEYFKNFTYLNRNKKAQIMKSIWLKQIITTKDYVATLKASKIIFAKISDSEFIKPQYDLLKEQ